MSFGQMVEMMVADFNSNACQIEVFGILSTHRISGMIAEHEPTSSTEGLKKFVSTIEEMAPQCPPHSLSKTPESNIVTGQYSFNGFITALREHTKLEEEILSLSGIPTGIRHSIADDTFVQKYGRNPT